MAAIAFPSVDGRPRCFSTFNTSSTETTHVIHPPTSAARHGDLETVDRNGHGVEFVGGECEGL